MKQLKNRIKNAAKYAGKAAKSLITAGLIYAAALTPMQRTEACTGAEQIGMAGAGGEVLADNSNATYWNPGLLVNVKKPEFSYCHNFKNEAAKWNIRYDNTSSFGMPIGTNNTFGIGCAYIDSIRGGNFNGKNIKEIWKSVLLSAGAKIYEKKQTKVLTGITLDYDRQINIDGSSKTINESLGADFGLAAILNSAIFNGDEFRAGVLYQSSSGNVRPAISETIENFNKKGKFTIAASLYDSLEKSIIDSLKIGLRQSLETSIGNINLESGIENLGLKPVNSLGVGYESPSKSFGIDASYNWFGTVKSGMLEFTKRF